MWIRKTKSGKVCYCERYKDPLTGKAKDVSVTFAKDSPANRKKALEKLADKKRKALEAAPDELTLELLVIEYRKDQKLSVRPSTYKRNYSATKMIMNILGKDTLVSQITARYVKTMLLKENESAGTSNERIKRIKALFRWAYKADLIDSTAIADKLALFPDKPHSEKIQDKYLEASELKIVLNSMHQEQWRLLTKFMALSGCRIGEAVAIERRDIDFKNKVIHITKTFDANNKQVGDVKTVKSYGDVYMQPELESCVREIIELQKNKVVGARLLTSLLFCNDSGKHINYYSYNKYLKSITSKMIGKSLTSHSLRHSCASILFEQGLSLDEVSRRLRHSNSKVTKEIYIHVTKKLQEKDYERLSHVRMIV